MPEEIVAAECPTGFEDDADDWTGKLGGSKQIGQSGLKLLGVIIGS